MEVALLNFNEEDKGEWNLVLTGLLNKTYRLSQLVSH